MTNAKLYKIQNTETGKIHFWLLADILENINRDRSAEWTDYDKTDWREGLEAFTEYIALN